MRYRAQLLAVGRGDDGVDQALTENLVAGPSEDRFGLLVPFSDASVDVGGDEGVIGGGDQAAQYRLAVPQSGLGGPLGGHVAQHGAGPGFTVGVGEEGPGHLGHEGGAVCPPERQLGFDRAPFVPLGQRRFPMGSVVGVADPVPAEPAQLVLPVAQQFTGRRVGGHDLAGAGIGEDDALTTAEEQGAVRLGIQCIPSPTHGPRTYPSGDTRAQPLAHVTFRCGPDRSTTAPPAHGKPRGPPGGSPILVVA
jgi:hypothetical protein